MTPREGTAPSRIEDPTGPFGTIEGSDEYVALLLQAVEETATDVGEDLRGILDGDRSVDHGQGRGEPEAVAA